MAWSKSLFRYAQIGVPVVVVVVVVVVVGHCLAGSVSDRYSCVAEESHTAVKSTASSGEVVVVVGLSSLEEYSCAGEAGNSLRCFLRCR